MQLPRGRLGALLVGITAQRPPLELPTTSSCPTSFEQVPLRSTGPLRLRPSVVESPSVLPLVLLLSSHLAQHLADEGHNVGGAGPTLRVGCPASLCQESASDMHG